MIEKEVLNGLAVHTRREETLEYIRRCSSVQTSSQVDKRNEFGVLRRS
jgi:hypothetical protein